MSLNRLLGWLPFLLLIWVPLVVADTQQPLPLDYAIPEQSFDPDQTSNLDFRAYTPGARLRFAKHSFGIVLRTYLPALPQDAADYNLVLEPRYLLEVDGWFRLKQDGGWLSEKRGRLLSNKPTYYSTQDLVYELPEHLDTTQPVYLLVRDRGASKSVSVSVEERQAYLLDDVSYSRYAMALYTVILVLAIVNLIFYAFLREQPFLWYGIYMVLALNGIIWQEGWVGRFFYLPDAVSTSRWLHLFSMLPVAFFFQFYRSYLGLDKSTSDGKVFLGFQVGFVAIILLSQLHSWWSGSPVPVGWVNLFNGFLAVGAISVFVLTLRFWIQGFRLAGYLFVANLVLIGATLTRIAYAFHIIVENTFWQTHAFELALAIDAVILSVALADRTLGVKKERDQAKVELVKVDTAYQREQLLADFVRQLQAEMEEENRPNASRHMDKLLFDGINRILEVAEVMVLTRKDEKIHYRCLGGNRILGSLFMKILNQQMPQFMKDCRSGLISRRNIRGFPDARERYQCLLIPVKIREEMDYCLLLLIPREQYLDRDLVSGLREFVEKAVHALMNAKNLEQLRYSARYDDLTGVLNRASMENQISTLLQQCRDGGEGLALAFVDIDHFKSLNDSMGHDYGDTCLKLLCKRLQQLLAEDALIGRFGGDEFLVLLPGMDYRQAQQVLEKLNPMLASVVQEEGNALSVSMGIAECRSGQRMPMAELLKQADMSLYAAKAAGRACIGPRVATAKTGQ